MLDPGRSIASILDHARPLLRRAPMIAPYETAADQGVGCLHQPHHHANRIPEKTAVARLMQQRGGDRAVEPHDLAGLDFLLTRAGKQDAIDRLPCFGPDGADCCAAPTSSGSTTAAAGRRRGTRRSLPDET